MASRRKILKKHGDDGRQFVGLENYYESISLEKEEEGVEKI